jgi:hypothetical protein
MPRSAKSPFLRTRGEFFGSFQLALTLAENPSKSTNPITAGPRNESGLPRVCTPLNSLLLIGDRSIFSIMAEPFGRHQMRRRFYTDVSGVVASDSWRPASVGAEHLIVGIAQLPGWEMWCRVWYTATASKRAINGTVRFVTTRFSKAKPGEHAFLDRGVCKSGAKTRTH